MTFYNERIFARAASETNNERILLRVTSGFLQRATSATSNERIWQGVTSNFFQRPNSATSSKQILQRVTSDFLQRPTSAASNKRIWQRVTSDFTTSNVQQVNFNEQRAMSEKLRLFLTHILNVHILCWPNRSQRKCGVNLTMSHPPNESKRSI